MPAVIAILGAYTLDIQKAHGHLALLLWVFALMIFGIFYWRANPSPRSFLHLLRENETLESKLLEEQDRTKEFQQAMNLLLWQSILSFSTRFMVVQYLRNKINSLEALREALSEINAPLVYRSEEIFGTAGSEKWNFAVYLYSNTSDKLIPVWREKAQTHPSEGDGRTWGRGEGHVGKAFVDKQAIITPNSTHPEVAAFSAAPGALRREYDASVYKSFASIPIGPIPKDNGLPYGILVGTSDREARFDRENTAILVHLADVIATLLALGEIDIDKLPTRDSANPEANPGDHDDNPEEASSGNQHA